MRVLSEDGYDFSMSPSADGTSLTLVAHKDDHEGRNTVTFHLKPEVAGNLGRLIRATCETAKDRRKAIRRATREEEKPDAR